MLPSFHYESTKPLSSVKIRETGGTKQRPRQACLLHAPPLWCRAPQARAHVSPGSRSKRPHEAVGSLNSHAWWGAFPAALVPPIVSDGGWGSAKLKRNFNAGFGNKVLHFAVFVLIFLPAGDRPVLVDEVSCGKACSFMFFLQRGKRVGQLLFGFIVLSPAQGHLRTSNLMDQNKHFKWKKVFSYASMSFTANLENEFRESRSAGSEKNRNI